MEGGVLNAGYESLVGAWRVPVRTGLTIGELALMVNSEMDVPCELDVVAMEGWQRSMEFADCGLPWMLPSPNMPTLDSVLNTEKDTARCYIHSAGGLGAGDGHSDVLDARWFGAG